ncbi:pentapeptide repeat-containing protein [Micromonospora radicis]|uniref:pentapeptide repeat-containing protein n=1 Tax=Micromonospora radicis TaxID=1894971 RepID=UPI001313F442|nr:pentapeptide repeat-containing protein [Micromonospora radicis]
MCPTDWPDRLGRPPDRHERVVLDQLAQGEQTDATGKLIADLVRNCCGAGEDRLKERIWLENVRIAGRLDLSRCRLKHPISFRNCRFDGGVDLSGTVCDETLDFVDCVINGLIADQLHGCKAISVVDCEITEADFAGAHLEHDLRFSRSQLKQRTNCPAFHGPDMVIEGGLFLDHVQVTGGVTLDSSYVAADLDCRGGRFSNGSALAINASWVHVGRELRCDEGFHSEGEVRLCWARAELVSFRNGTLDNPNGLALRADSLRVDIGCYLDQDLHATGTVRLVGAQIEGELSCSGGRFDGRGGVAIEAERLTATDVFIDQGFAAHGAVRLVGARLERQLTCTGGHFDNPSGSALDATGLICRGSVYLDKDPDLEQGFTANGQVSLSGASVAEAVVCTDGLFHHEADVAIDASGLTTDGNVMLDGGFRAVGEVRLARATVGRQLDCTGGVFQALGRTALDLTGLVGRGDVLLTNGFRATGEVSLRNADVSRDVNLSGGHLSGVGEKSLDAYGLRVGGSLILLPAEKPTQIVDLRYANVTRLNDSEMGYPAGNRVELEGLTYQSLESNLGYEQRIQILEHMKSYSRQPYQQLSRIYRDAGKDVADREVAVAGLKQLRKRDKLRPHSKAWNVFMWLTVRYGYRLYQPILIALPFAILNVIFYHTAEHHDLMEPVAAKTDDGHADATHCPANYPCFNPAAYSLQLLIPAINLYQIDKWIPDASKPWGTPLLFWTWLMIIIGWVLGFSLVAALSQALRRE